MISTNFKRLCLGFILFIANVAVYGDNSTLFGANNTVVNSEGMRIELIEANLWRDWQPMVSRAGPDGGSPLKVVTQFSFHNKGTTKKIAHWEASLYSSDFGEIFPIELWDANSNKPWGGDLNGNERSKVELRTSSGPYIKSGRKVVLVVDFFVDGELMRVKSNLIEIVSAH